MSKNKEIDRKQCFVCKKHITDDKEFVCTECYEKSLKELENSDLYKEIKKIDNPEWLSLLVIMVAIFWDKGETK